MLSFSTRLLKRIRSMEKNNVILIGMPTSGKSTVGVILAKLMGMDFVDTDLLIQKREHRKLSRIIEEDGLEGFLNIENTVCREVNLENTVIATGGSVVYGKAYDVQSVIYATAWQRYEIVRRQRKPYGF